VIKKNEMYISITTGKMDKGSSEAKSTLVLLLLPRNNGTDAGNNGTLGTLSRHSSVSIHFGINVSFFPVFILDMIYLYN
jgi:hypothetical protein